MASGERIAQRIARRQGVEPDEELPPDFDPRSASGWEAVRYILRVLVLIAASSAGYLFLGGVQTFGVIFVRREYGLGRSAAISVLALLVLGALLGVLSGGRIADRMLRGGRLDARVLVASAAFGGAALIALPPFLFGWSLPLAVPLFIAATAALSCGNPPLDAARLDVMPPALWGRAEAVRTVLRSLAVAAAPLLFGWLAGELGSGSGEALRLTFLIMLAPLAATGLILLYARRTYPGDVAGALGPLLAGVVIEVARPLFSSTEGYAATWWIASLAALISLLPLRRLRREREDRRELRGSRTPSAPVHGGASHGRSA